MNNVDSATLSPGFSDAVLDGQSAFRSALSATAYPGRIFTCDLEIPTPRPFDVATAALCLSLFDLETTIWLDPEIPQEVPAYLRFHCGASITNNLASAQFAVITDATQVPSLSRFNSGNLQYPDTSATLIIQVPSLTSGPNSTWSGPGINGKIDVSIDGVADTFWEERALEQQEFPLGVDVFFTCAHQVVGSPRTVKVAK